MQSVSTKIIREKSKMFHPHIKKICALSFLFVGGMPVFAMEREEEGAAVRAVSPAVVHLKGSNIEFNNALTSPLPVLIENDGDFRTSADSYINLNSRAFITRIPKIP